MKIIFLDHDGVICLSNNWGSRNKKKLRWNKNRNSDTGVSVVPLDCRLDDFDKKSVEVLNEILRQTDAEIVVSSDWRYHASLEEMGEYYLSQGIIKKPIGYTRRTEDIDIELWNKRFRFYAKLEEERAFEITHYLSEFPSITHWVAVDDLNMGKFINYGGYTIEYDWGLDNFVHTTKSREGIKQSGIKEKIIKYLI